MAGFSANNKVSNRNLMFISLKKCKLGLGRVSLQIAYEA